MRAAIICNPRAGKYEADGEISAATAVLRGAGWSVDVFRTDGPDDAGRIAREVAEDGMDVALVAGGDGTLNEAVQGLAGTETALGYLPYGTVNIWARELGITTDPVIAAQEMVRGRMERVDLGRANDRYFLLMAGIGFDADVVRRAQGVERYKQRYGILPYVAVGLSAVPLYRGGDVELRYDGVIRRVQALMVVVANTRLYGGYFKLTPGAVANDGWLDLCIVKGKGPIAMVRQSLPVLISRSVAHSDVELLRVRNVTIGAPDPLHYQLDGELIGETPVEFGVEPLALRVIVPEHFSSSLIA